MKAYKIWYEAGYQSWEFGGTYSATSEAHAIAIAMADGMGWATVIASDTDPNLSAKRRADMKAAQTKRRDKLAQAANRFGLKTIDRLVAKVLALSDEDAATLRACFEEVTQKT